MNEKSLYKRGLLSPSEISAFSSQISMVLKSGMSIAEGIDIMYDGAKNPAGRNILKSIYNQVEIGTPLYLALEATGKFPDYMVSMVEIGEATGKLDDVAQSLSDYYEREESISRAVRSAVIYPLVMIGMMLAVIILLIVRVMPIFNEVFQSLGAQMTGFSLAVMSLGQTLGQYSLIIVGTIASFAVFVWVFSNTQIGREVFDSFRTNFFLTRNLYSKIASGRFASAMSLMLASGMDVDESLKMVYKLVKTRSVRQKIRECQRLMDMGTTFSEALSGVSMFSGIYARMVNVAFKTGSIDDIMKKIALRYEEETNTSINNIISIVEPSLVAILSVIVGVILLSVMLPLMGIMAMIG
ncbi:MAG: type II secretion system F family protein [Defluviitaleaceae bacterium]|nr:type II secretion system F family protein [Defluviitaleaceae bacterium]